MSEVQADYKVNGRNKKLNIDYMVKLIWDEHFDSFKVFINDVDLGQFNKVDRSDKQFSYFPKNQHKINGNHLIAIGKTLNEINEAEINQN